tara:strand:- start:84 stop:389 length:306 start_codon:yes stop_codon:yes gene_type:complete
MMPETTAIIPAALTAFLLPNQSGPYPAIMYPKIADNVAKTIDQVIWVLSLFVINLAAAGGQINMAITIIDPTDSNDATAAIAVMMTNEKLIIEERIPIVFA